MTGDARSGGLRQRLRDALPAALKARDAAAVNALRSAIAALDNAEAVTPTPGDTAGLAIEQSPSGVGSTEVPRATLSEHDVESRVRSEIHDRVTAAHAYDRAGEHDRASRLRAEAATLAALLADHHGDR